jgi:hypothetical protein
MHLVLLTALSLGCGKAEAPAASVQTLALDNAQQHPYGFSSVAGAVELKNGMLVVADRKEKTLMRVDFVNGDAAPIGRTGRGPLEYGYVNGRLLPGGGDTVYYRDFQNARILLIGPEGRPARTAPFTSPSTAARPFSFVAVDRSGRFYGSWRTQRRDTAFSTISRLDAAIGVGESLATRHSIVRPEQSTQHDAKGYYTVAWGPDYMPQTVWAVLPDGRVAVLRDSSYRVEFTDGHATSLGPTLAWNRILVSKAERMARIDSMQAEYREAENKPMAETPSGEIVPLEYRVIEPPVVSSTHPPFTELHASPDNHLWVRVPNGPTDRGTHYEILDSTGTRIGRVAIPPGERLIALGRAAVYATRIDADGFMHLRRYALPAALRPGTKR